MSADVGDFGDWRPIAVGALRDALESWRGDLRPLADELVEHLASVLGRGDGSQIAALTVPLAVFSGLRGIHPPAWLFATAAATFLAWDVLDDDMDGDPTKFWRQRSAADRTIGAHLLIATAAGQASLWADPASSRALTRVYLDMVATVTEGQLRAEIPLDSRTTPQTVAAGIDARSGDMLAGFAEMAAIAAGADAPTRQAAARFGRELAVARQLVNDVTELESERTSDLRNRTATMVAAFALQRTPVDGRDALLNRLHSAATDSDLRHRMIDGELQPALADTRMLARLHLAEAKRLACSFARHPCGREALEALLRYTADGLVVGAPAGACVGAGVSPGPTGISG